MKKLSLTLIAVAATWPLAAKNIVIQDPVYEFKTTGIYEITKVEQTQTDTRLTIHSVFLPHWWVMFTQKDYIQDCQTGEKHFATGIENGEFDKKIHMPGSGDSTFVLIFPKLNESAGKINFGLNDESEGRPSIFGVSLDKENQSRPQAASVPAGVQKWLESETADTPRQSQNAVKSGSFYPSGSVRIVGYIKGYDPRAGFSSGMVYQRNEATMEDAPTVVQIHPDGRFETTFPAPYPVMKSLAINGKNIPFYAEPGQTLAVILDWEDFLLADRFRDKPFTFENAEFMGPAARVNSELTSAKARLTPIPVDQFLQQVQTLSPEEFKTTLRPIVNACSEEVEKLCAEQPLAETTKTLLRNDISVTHAMILLYYDLQNRMAAPGKKTEPKIFPDDYYDFLRGMPLNSPSILPTEYFGAMINYLEHSSPLSTFHAVLARTQPKTSFTQYLFDELGLPETDGDKAYLTASDSLPAVVNSGTKSEEEGKAIMQELNDMAKEFRERYSRQWQQYQEKYIVPLKKLTFPEMQALARDMKDSAAIALGINPSLVYDMIKVRSLPFAFTDLDRNDARTLLTEMKSGISDPYLVHEAEKLYAQRYPDNRKQARELPRDKAGDYFRQIIAPFKGKYIFVDFWGTYCGPCLAGIRNMKDTRERYRNSPDAEFIFITSAGDSSKAAYDKLVKEQNLINTFWLNPDDYLLMRQLFGFNGIPRYVLVDRKGRILDGNFNMHLFEKKLKELLEGEKGR